MPLPNDYSPWENLQSTVRMVQNRIVRQEFRDLGDDWEPNISTPRDQLRQACMHDDGDSAIMTLVRLLFFYACLRKAADFQAPLYGIPVTNFQETYRYQPQVKLYFEQDLAATPDEKQPLRSQITFRYAGETATTFSPAQGSTANRIRTEFATGTPYRWNRGHVICNYRDKENGYQTQLYAYSPSEGREVVKKVLSIRNHAYNDDFYSYSNSDAEFPANPGTQYIYGKSRPKIRQRPIGYVRFKYATLGLHGLPRDICLVDTTGRFRDALEKAY